MPLLGGGRPELGLSASFGEPVERMTEGRDSNPGVDGGPEVWDPWTDGEIWGAGRGDKVTWRRSEPGVEYVPD